MISPFFMLIISSLIFLQSHLLINFKPPFPQSNNNLSTVTHLNPYYPIFSILASALTGLEIRPSPQILVTAPNKPQSSLLINFKPPFLHSNHNLSTSNSRYHYHLKIVVHSQVPKFKIPSSRHARVK
jgi:hypothetical protein